MLLLARNPLASLLLAHERLLLLPWKRPPLPAGAGRAIGARLLVLLLHPAAIHRRLLSFGWLRQLKEQQTGALLWSSERLDDLLAVHALASYCAQTHVHSRVRTGLPLKSSSLAQPAVPAKIRAQESLATTHMPALLCGGVVGVGDRR